MQFGQQHVIFGWNGGIAVLVSCDNVFAATVETIYNSRYTAFVRRHHVGAIPMPRMSGPICRTWRDDKAWTSYCWRGDEPSIDGTVTLFVNVPTPERCFVRLPAVTPSWSCHVNNSQATLLGELWALAVHLCVKWSDSTCSFSSRTHSRLLVYVILHNLALSNRHNHCGFPRDPFAT